MQFWYIGIVLHYTPCYMNVQQLLKSYNRKKPSPRQSHLWNDIRRKQYDTILNSEMAIVCQRSPLTASEYEHLKYALRHRSWKSAIVNTATFNDVLLKRKYNFHMTGSTLVLFGDIKNWNEFKSMALPQNVFPIGIKLLDRFLNFEGNQNVDCILSSRFNLLHLLQATQQTLLEAIPYQASNLIQNLNLRNK
eukprot:NODE_533_length_6371_cov_1.461894.p5 type:complete len:192 gc:universal NODE_533_length_6371_cov_1.461894:264-839(+)